MLQRKKGTVHSVSFLQMFRGIISSLPYSITFHISNSQFYFKVMHEIKYFMLKYSRKHIEPTSICQYGISAIYKAINNFVA